MIKIKTITLLNFILFLSQFSYAQKIENLVFEGAGIRGIAYAGAVMQMEELDKMKDVKKVGGTSAGAITALAISLGYKGAELKDLISSTDFSQFNDPGNFPMINGTERMINNYGWYQHDEFKKWIRSLIKDKTGNPDITFAELEIQGFIPLYVCSTFLDLQRLIVLSSETFPQMKICDAITMSMSVPLYFQALFVDDNGTVYKDKPEGIPYHVAIDGGLIGNFPIQMFDENGFDTSEERKANYKTLGFRIDTANQIAADKENQGIAAFEIENINDYVIALYSLTIESLNRQSLTDDDWARTVSVSCDDIGPKIKELTDEQKNKLVENGKQGVNEFFEKHPKR